MVRLVSTVSDADLEGLRGHLEAGLSDYLADLARLVNVDCGSYTKAGVDHNGRWFADALAELGAQVTVEANDALGDTVVATLEGRGVGRCLLIGHLDTVFDEGTVAERPFAIRDGRAFGPGVDDMKSGLLSGIYALRALRALRSAAGADAGPADWLPFARLTYIANPDEEIGSPASTPVIRRHAEDADVCFVLESARDNGDIVSARKGIADYQLAIAGRAAHAGVEPEKGRSAIVEAAHKTLALTALNGRWPGATINVGVIEGGTRPNVVAESCTLKVDVRAISRADLDAVESAIDEIAMTATVPDTVCVISLIHSWQPMEKTPAVAVLAEQAIELAARLDFELRDTATGGASDANTTSGMGVPTLDGLGPVGGADHAPGEYVEIDSIVPRTALLAALLLSAAGSR
jgi:glutamate carboxypeptidase